MIDRNSRGQLGQFFQLLIMCFLTAPAVITNSLYGQDDARQVYNQAVTSAIEGDFETAGTRFKRALEIDSLYVPAKLNLKVVLDVIGKKLPPAAVIYYFKAIYFENLDSLDKKMMELDKALSVSPEFGLAYNERGITWAKKQEFAKAIDDYNRALLILPDYPEIYFNKALSCDNAQRFAEAREAYRKFLEHVPTSYAWYIIYARKRIWEMDNPSDPESPQ